MNDKDIAKAVTTIVTNNNSSSAVQHPWKKEMVLEDGTKYTITTSNMGGVTYGYVYTETSHADLIPQRVIFNPPYTICIFPDGSKTMVKCGDDEDFIEEVGVQACIMKKLFPSRLAFKKLVAAGYHQPEKPLKTWG